MWRRQSDRDTARCCNDRRDCTAASRERHGDDTRTDDRCTNCSPHHGATDRNGRRHRATGGHGVESRTDDTADRRPQRRCPADRTTAGAYSARRYDHAPGRI